MHYTRHKHVLSNLKSADGLFSLFELVYTRCYNSLPLKLFDLISIDSVVFIGILVVLFIIFNFHIVFVFVCVVFNIVDNILYFFRALFFLSLLFFSLFQISITIFCYFILISLIINIFLMILFLLRSVFMFFNISIF